MEHKDIKADLDSSIDKWNTLYCQINEEWKDQKKLQNESQFDLAEVINLIEFQKSSIAEDNEENDKLKDDTESHKAIVKEFVTTKKLQDQKVECLINEVGDILENYNNLKYKHKVLKDDPHLLSRLYKYLHEYQNIAKVIKPEKKHLTVYLASKDESASIVNNDKTKGNISKRINELETTDGTEQVTNHYDSGELKDVIADKPAAKSTIDRGEPDGKAFDGLKSSALPLDKNNENEKSQTKNETDKQATGIKTECSDPKTKESSLYKNESKNLEGPAHDFVSNDVCKENNSEKQFNLKLSEDKNVSKSSTNAGKYSKAISQEEK